MPKFIAKTQQNKTMLSMLRLTIILILTQAIIACSSSPVTSSKIRNWRVGTVAPSLYPVIVERGVYGLNKENTWTSKLHTHTHMWSNSELLTVRKTFPDYDGFGIPLAEETISMQSQIIKRTQLPDIIKLQWASLVEGRFYATVFELSAEIKKRMLTQQSYIGNYGQTWECYETDIVFGLLPTGVAKVWLTGCGDQYTPLENITASAVSLTDYKGKSIEDYQYKLAVQRAKLRVEKINQLQTKQSSGQEKITYGENSSTVPWDKINKEYTIAPSWHHL